MVLKQVICILFVIISSLWTFGQSELSENHETNFSLGGMEISTGQNFFIVSYDNKIDTFNIQGTIRPIDLKIKRNLKDPQDFHYLKELRLDYPFFYAKNDEGLMGIMNASNGRWLMRPKHAQIYVVKKKFGIPTAA